MHVDPLIPQVDTNMKDLSREPYFDVINVSSLAWFYLFYHDLFDEFLTPTFPPYHLNLCPIGLDYIHVHDGVVTQSGDENFESLVHYLFNLQSLAGELEDSTSPKVHEIQCVGCPIQSN